MLFASGSDEPDGWAARGIAVACITFAVLLHSTFPKWGMRLFDVLGIFKVVVLLFIVFSGFAALAGHRKVPDPHNFDNAVSRDDHLRFHGSFCLFRIWVAHLSCAVSFGKRRWIRRWWSICLR